MTKGSDLEPRDLLVYATIKKYINYLTNETFVGLEKISEDSGYTIPTVRKSIAILKEKGYISVSKKGRSNIYKFNKYKNFEPFSYKSYIIATQQHMFKDIEGIGKISYGNEDLSKILNISPKTIQRLDKSLIEKGYLNIVKTTAIDNTTGLKINEKIFHLNELEQAVIWTLQKHDEKINEHEDRLSALEKQLSIVLKENAELKKDINKQNTNDDLLVL
jgi:Mn-dependent DtxR family transcriptional regulator